MWCCCGPSNLSPIQFLVLLLLSKQPMHGYELFKMINDQFGEKWKLNPGAIYKTLAKLVEKQFITAEETVKGKTIYQPTAKGRAALTKCIEWSEDWIEFTRSCSSPGSKTESKPSAGSSEKP
ncbi:MAG: PadR family transcriptional regulator [Candidatus Bathyarchaeota archaeon]|nr:MAG: PadR family transcriptional regulator [Candidatus Bathyarchaeota archaeon]